jgi:hypothetical protein
MKPLLSAAALAAGIALAQDAYARSILSRPMPSNKNARMRECNWLRAEIAEAMGNSRYHAKRWHCPGIRTNACRRPGSQSGQSPMPSRLQIISHSAAPRALSPHRA